MIQSVMRSLVFLALAACAQPVPPGDRDPLPGDCGPVTASGFCGVAFGMTPADAERAFVLPLSTHAGVEPGKEPSCYLLFPESRPDDLAFMIVDGIVARVDVHMSGLDTEAGVEVGTPETEVLSRYQGQAEVFPNKYDPASRDIVVPHRNGQLVFQTDGEKVTEYRAGSPPAIGLVERCG